MREFETVIRPTQVDTFGHLNHAVYLEIFEWARWEWAAAEGMGLDRLVAEERTAPAVLHVDLSFLKELRMHEAVRVRTWVQALESVKGVIGQEMVKADGAVAARLWLTFTMFHLDRRRAVALPAALRASFEADGPYRAERAAEEAAREARRQAALGRGRGGGPPPDPEG
ncbi:MAG TPA: thioesterase family protein [Myxococcota bacterium]|nr:thioesterase family protein [Myxococcota bacterium]HRY91925.1 thioesterase family protein [Myxococcota bacterium]HSA21109.1 thioesterase family protein [Myxococcota bacterium]